MKLKKMNAMQAKVLMLIPEGISNPISVNTIQTILDIQDKRTVFTTVASLVEEFNIPIGSLRVPKHNGLFIPTTEEEKMIGMQSYIEQAKSMKNRATAIQNANYETAKLYKEQYKEIELPEDKQSELFYSVHLDKEEQDTISK